MPSPLVEWFVDITRALYEAHTICIQVTRRSSQGVLQLPPHGLERWRLGVPVFEMPRPTYYSHAVNILNLENEEVKNIPVSRQADGNARGARERKLIALALQEKERRKHQDPCKTSEGPPRRKETPKAPNNVNLAAPRRPAGDAMREPNRTKLKQPEDVSTLLASRGGSCPPTARSRLTTGCSRPTTACSRPPTACSRPARTARHGSATSRIAGTARPGTGLSALQREVAQEEFESNDASGAFPSSLEHGLQRLEERRELAAREVAREAVQEAAQEEMREEAQEAAQETALDITLGMALLARDEPPNRCSSSHRSHRSSTITSCSKRRVEQARAAQSTIEIA